MPLGREEPISLGYALSTLGVKAWLSCTLRALHVMPSSDRIDLVVSHNQEASTAALRIVDSVEAQGHPAWADVKAFYSPLISAEKQIARAFTRARVICLFVGEKFRNTRWCQEEYALGLRSEQDLSICRVITVHDGDSGKALIPSALADRPTFSYTDSGLQGIVKFLSALPDHLAALAAWTQRGTADRGDLLRRLPVEERTKLVVEHVEFLVKHFALGHFEQGSEKHAQRLGLIGTTTSGTPVHLSPALLMELAWNWATDILGKYSVHKLIHSPIPLKDEAMNVAAVMPFLRLTALFRQYLTTARDRHSPPLNTEIELLSIVDHVLCGFCVLCARTRVPVDEAFRDVDELLSLFSGSESGVSRCAAYLRDNLPDIAFPENSVRRGATIYSLLHPR
jgi:TIR domain